MGKPVPIDLLPERAIEIDGTLVANALGLEPAVFKRLLEHRKIAVLCERGTGDDAGLYRASYYYQGKRARLVVDATGHPIDSQHGNA